MPAQVISFKELVRRFRKLGYEGPYSGGKHLFMIKGPQKIHIPNPHKSKDIHISLVREILRQAGIDRKEWDKL
jgi:predicted RNA binding protein YcfA (HicA-like mRNA interferase family)